MTSLDITGNFARRTAACHQLLVAVAVVMLACQNTYASNKILDTGGFETYSVGQLTGQSAGPKYWSATGSGGGTATVETSIGTSLSKDGRGDI